VDKYPDRCSDGRHGPCPRYKPFTERDEPAQRGKNVVPRLPSLGAHNEGTRSEVLRQRSIPSMLVCIAEETYIEKVLPYERKVAHDPDVVFL
jgi:hypothetical protein